MSRSKNNLSDSCAVRLVCDRDLDSSLRIKHYAWHSVGCPTQLFNVTAALTVAFRHYTTYSQRRHLDPSRRRQGRQIYLSNQSADSVAGYRHENSM